MNGNWQSILNQLSNWRNSNALVKWDLFSPRMLRSVDCLLNTGVSEEPIGPNFKSQAVQEELLGRWRWDPQVVPKGR
jgi:hypothetical protein